MELSIIIVNWNSKEYLRKCVESILAEMYGIEFEIIVIDSASFDGCGEMLMQCYPQVRFIQSEKNLGFAKANNLAFHDSRGRHILFLNPDTELFGPAINILYDHLQQLQNAGAVGCRLLNADMTVQTSCILAFPTILNQFLDSEFLRNLLPRSSLWGNAPLYRCENGPEEVEAICGACVMVKRNVFEEVGLFSEDYFMYTEDIDLCFKIRRANYKNYYVPDVAVIHYGGGSTQKKASVFSAITMRESRWRFLRKTRGKAYSYSYRISTLIAAMGRMAVLTILLPMFVIRQGGKSWVSSVRKWGAVMAWSLGFENSLTSNR